MDDIAGTETWRLKRGCAFGVWGGGVLESYLPTLRDLNSNSSLSPPTPYQLLARDLTRSSTLHFCDKIS